MTAWIHKSGKGWLKDYRIKKEKEPPKEEVKKKENKENNKVNTIQVDEAPAQSRFYSAIYYVFKCPKCGSRNLRCYRSDPPVRYHQCKDCLCQIKSYEADYGKNA